MQKQQTIECAFCQGIGKHPYFGSTCPTCKGKGENTVVGSFVACRDCRGLGQKRGTTLTCYTCGGLGVLPDTREIVAKARKEIKEAREEIEKERPARQRPEPHPPASSREASRAGAMAGGEEFREKPLKTESERLRKKPSEIKETHRSNAGRRKRGAVESAIASFCNDCALGEDRKCWNIECPLAPYSPMAAMISH